MCTRIRNVELISTFDDDDDDDDNKLIPSRNVFSSDDGTVSVNIPEQTEFPSKNDASLLVPPTPPKTEPVVAMKEVKKAVFACCTKSNRTAKPQNPSRSSQMRGVTKHRLTGKYEAHLWDSSSAWSDAKAWWQNERKAGLFGWVFDRDRGCQKLRQGCDQALGRKANLNFDYKTYAKDIENMKSYDFASYIAALRRESSGFTRGVSKYRGVTKHVKSTTDKNNKTTTKPFVGIAAWSRERVQVRVSRNVSNRS